MKSSGPSVAEPPIVIELFSSQACIFCPQADRFFGDLVAQAHIIGLNCHVDYFDVKTGSLSRPFCTQRQKWYAETLDTGPLYTPQVIIQGQQDIVGYRFDQLTEKIRAARETAREEVVISMRPGEPDHYMAQSRLDMASVDGHPRVWVALYDEPHEVQISSGRNAGQRVTYYNIASDLKDLGEWTGEPLNFKIVPTATQSGFIIVIQDRLTARIYAAGQYRFPQASVPDFTVPSESLEPIETPAHAADR